MKKLNKFMLFLAAAVFTLTACEKSVEREPSPVFGKNVAAFEKSGAAVEINPAKAPLEYELFLVRSSVEDQLLVNINVDGDILTIKVPSAVTFAPGESRAALKLTFPDAEVDKTYSVKLIIPEENRSPYLDGPSEFDFTVSIASWEPASTQAIVYDGLVGSMYGVTQMAWYVSYMEKINTDGTFDIRLLNPYAGYPTTDPDQFGIYSAYPYNEKGDVLAGTYNWDLHIDAENKVTFEPFKMGMLWSADYGEFSAGLSDGAFGTYDPATKIITFEGGACWATMANLTKNYTWAGVPVIINLDATAYQNDHLTIADFNAEDIQWKEVESVVNQFESTIFKFTNEEQKLFAAVNPLSDNPKSPYLNLFCLKDAYAAGGNLAFYWNGEDGALQVPAHQNTKLSFMGQDLFIEAALGEVATQNVKGTEVKVFTFDIYVVGSNGSEVGEFIETFLMSDKEIIFEKADFVGTFNLAGYSPFDDSEDVRPIEIKAEGEDLIILGLDYCDTIWTDFDAETGILSIAPQALGGVFTYNEADYPLGLYTLDAGGAPSTTAVISLAFKLDGIAHLTPSTEAIGFLVRAENLGWLDGLYDFDLVPAEPEEEVPAEGAPKRVRELSKKAKRAAGTTPSVEHLSFKGQYRPRLIIK